MINIVIDQLLACKTLTPKNEVIQCFRFKQAKEGECTVAKPSFYQLTEKSKWNAWKELEGMGRAEAMTQYVEKVKDIQFIESNKNKEVVSTYSHTGE